MGGAVLIGIAGLHYARGTRAQSEAREAFDRQLAGGYAPVSQSVARRDDLPRSAAVSPAAGYPFGQPIAKLRIPIAEMDWVVFGGTDDATLEKGPGHVPGTAMPGQDGPPQNCVITAHRDAHFRHLGWLRKGHLIELETPAGTKRYRVVSREIVTPKTVRVLDPTPKPRLTLITCYPFTYIGSAPERLVVVAEPIAPRPSRERAKVAPATR
ncbi:MAG TPA: class D sortase [Thermoanaerobaculia bacterium]